MGCQRASINRGPPQANHSARRRRYRQRRRSHPERSNIQNQLPSNNSSSNGLQVNSRFPNLQHAQTDSCGPTVVSDSFSTQNESMDRGIELQNIGSTRGDTSAINIEEYYTVLSNIQPSRTFGRSRRQISETDNIENRLSLPDIDTKVRKSEVATDFYRQTPDSRHTFSRQDSPNRTSRFQRHVWTHHLGIWSPTDNLFSYEDLLEDLVKRLLHSEDVHRRFGGQKNCRYCRQGAPPPDTLPMIYYPMSEEERGDKASADVGLDCNATIGMGFDGTADSPADLLLDNSKNHQFDDDDDEDSGLATAEMEAAEAYLSLSIARQLQTVLNKPDEDDSTKFDATSNRIALRDSDISISDDEECSFIGDRQVSPVAVGERSLATQKSHEFDQNDLFTPPMSHNGSKTNKKRSNVNDHYGVSEIQTSPINPPFMSAFEDMSLGNNDFPLTPERSMSCSPRSPCSPPKRTKAQPKRQD